MPLGAKQIAADTVFEGLSEAPPAKDVIAGFRAGTHIRTTRGPVPVDDLTTGDRVITASGKARPIVRVVHGEAIGTASIRIARSALADHVPSRDLWVSPVQTLLIDGARIQAVRLVNDASIVHVHASEPVPYFQIALESPDILLAEDTPADGSPIVPDADHCTPRASADAQAAAYNRIAQRAGIGDVAPGALHGFLEDCSPNRIAGWAQDSRDADSPVRLVIMLDGIPLTEVLADIWRSDLADAGIGDGQHSFDFRPAATIPSHQLSTIQVTRVADGAELPRLSN